MGESIPALGWVMVEKTPAPHVSDMWQCGEFNQQKIVMANKGKDETQAAWLAPSPSSAGRAGSPRHLAAHLAGRVRKVN